MAEGIDDKGDARKMKQPLTLEEIQIKYYSEGPEAARTSQYIEVTDRPSTSRIQPQDTRDKHLKTGSFHHKKGQYEKNIASGFTNEAEIYDEDLTLNYSSLSDLEHGLHRPPISGREYANLTPEEKSFVKTIQHKQRTYQNILLSLLSEDSEGPRKKRPIYYDTDDDDDEDFYNRADDYPEDDWHYHMLKFYKKYKPFILFMKAAFQVVIFLSMFAFVVTVYTPVDESEEYDRLKAEGHFDS